MPDIAWFAIIMVVVVGAIFYFGRNMKKTPVEPRKPGEWGDLPSNDWGDSN